MKKFLVLICTLGFLFGSVGTATAILLTDTQSIGVTLTERPLSGWNYASSYSYSHLQPAEYGVPQDVANSATLTVSVNWIGTNDVDVRKRGILRGSLNERDNQINWCKWSWDTPSGTMVDIANIFVSCIAGDLLDLTINAYDGFGDWKLELSSSTIALDNTEYADTAMPFSQPITMLLLGSGLIGLGSFGRKKLFKNASRSEHLSVAHS